MIEVKPIFWRLALAQWKALTAFGLAYAFYKWLLEWPAAWIILLLMIRSLVISFIQRDQVVLEISKCELSGPDLLTGRRIYLDLEKAITLSQFGGITFLESESGIQITYRRKSYDPTEIAAFERLIARHIAKHTAQQKF